MANKTTYTNIGDIHNNDEFYRYKMPTIELAIEGKGNGVKTRVVNIENIALALDRPANVIMKFFSLNLGTSIEQTNILRGNHSKDVLTKSLSTFIDIYVLCKTCTNPETTLKVKNDTLRASCKACGEKHILNDTKTIDSIIKLYRKK